MTRPVISLLALLLCLALCASVAMPLAHLATQQLQAGELYLRLRVPGVVRCVVIYKQKPGLRWCSTRPVPVTPRPTPYGGHP